MAEISYRKTQQGEWVVMGPVGAIKKDRVVTVTKSDGTTKEVNIWRVGRPFETAQGTRVYGYVDYDWKGYLLPTDREADGSCIFCERPREETPRGSYCLDSGSSHA